MGCKSCGLYFCLHINNTHTLRRLCSPYSPGCLYWTDLSLVWKVRFCSVCSLKPLFTWRVSLARVASLWVIGLDKLHSKGDHCCGCQWSCIFASGLHIWCWHKLTRCHSKSQKCVNIHRVWHQFVWKTISPNLCPAPLSLSHIPPLHTHEVFVSAATKNFYKYGIKKTGGSCCYPSMVPPPSIQSMLLLKLHRHDPTLATHQTASIAICVCCHCLHDRAAWLQHRCVISYMGLSLPLSHVPLSYEKGFGTVGVQSKNPLLEGDKVSVFQKAQTLCHLWKYCASSLLERNPSCFRERAPCRAVVLCLRLKKVVARQQWKMDDANCKYGCF